MDDPMLPLKDGWNSGLRGDDPRLCPYEVGRDRNTWLLAHSNAVFWMQNVPPKRED